MKRCSYILLLLALLVSSCSTQKNTRASRAYHAMKVNYNIYYNGNTAFEEGLQDIARANKDDYTTLLNLYPVSNHKAAEAAKGKMDRTIEKCRKCIKLHSIKKRPKADPKRTGDPAYREWLKQEEFNPAMPKAWLLLGKAEFHKGEFLESIGTFNYITQHFSYDKDVVAQCQLWSVRAYAESDWLYEADDLLRKVQVDDLKRKNASLYSAATADLRLKQKQYKEAIPHIKIAMQDEKRKGNRPRFAYVLAQLYELTGQKEDARAYYKEVINMQPDWEMDFNARIHLAQLEHNTAAALRDLQKMASRYKYKDKLDQIYGAMGNICLAQGDTTKALEYYAKGIQESTQNGYAKAQVLITAGDLYFGQKDYVHAEPCYTEAATILSAENEDYKRVRKRSEVLSELIVEYNTVLLQDSLQRLSQMTEEEQLKVCEQLVSALIEQEKNDSIAAAQAARDEENGTKDGLQSVNTSNMIGGGGSKEWYFYNPDLIRQGQQQFRQKWGNRKLEDNWRRKAHSNAENALSSVPQAEDPTGEEMALEADSAAVSDSLPPVATDPHDPYYYMQQIPRTEAELQASNDQIATALYNMVGIYQDKLEDRALADETFAEMRRRFPNDPRLADLYYMQYLTALKQNDTIAAENYRLALLREFPESNYSSVVKDPRYFDKLRTMAAEQDSVYEATYAAYKRSDYATIRANKAYAEENYPLSPLMPRFLFLNAVAVAKTNGQDAFIAELRDLVERYPDSELGTMAKDFLALMNQGAESQKGGTTSSLADKRTEESKQEEEVENPDETNKMMVVLIAIPKDEVALNNLLYNVALYNFTRFMIKDFDLRTVPNFSDTQSALEISGFDSPEEVEWYKGLLSEDADLQAVFTQLGAEVK